ncbi:MAG: sporulation protein YjcZ [Bacilli bacterium]|nr:sporulation protein YjcZ [Bacilli bacterium]
MTYYPYRYESGRGYFVALVLVLFILLVIITKSKEN